MKKIQVSVGIPAYNEERNIGAVLGQILSQKEIGFKLLEVLVISDGSRDSTARVVKSIKDKRIKFFDDGQRLGQAERQNQIISKCRGDILVLVEADTKPYNAWTLANLVGEYTKKSNAKVGMVVGREQTETPILFIEKIFWKVGEIKQKTFDEFRGGDNLYNSGGHTMRALARRYFEKLNFPKDAPEDCYCYFRLKQCGFLMKRALDARVLAKNISTTSDRQSHGQKFYSGKIAMKKYFNSGIIDGEYGFPKVLLFKQVTLSFVRSPFYTLLAIAAIAVNYYQHANINLGFIEKATNLRG